MATKVTREATTIDLHYPKAGIDVSMPLAKQPARPMGNGQYARTTPFAVNVRTFEPRTNRDRGGSRPGLKRYIDALLSASLGGTNKWVVQHLAAFTSMESSVQTSQSGRRVSLLGCSQGVIKWMQPGDTAWTTPTNTAGTPPMNIDGIVFSTSLNQKQFWVDGTNYVYYDSSDDTTKTWTASNGGTLPVDDDDNTARLCCTWRGRLMLSGVFGDPQNWFGSRLNDPFDYEYGADDNDVAQAVAGNNSPAGTVGDVVNCLLPYSDDTLIFGGDSTLWVMQGDPMYGGQIQRLSDACGMAWGRPFCKDPFGAVYFFSSRNSIFRMVPGKELTRVSGPIQRLIDDVDTGNNSITMAWDEREQGFHTFITPLARDSQGRAPTATHLFWESRAGAWTQEEFEASDHNPLCCCIMDGNEPSDRVVLTGGFDGYVRAFDRDAETDDGKVIRSHVVIGPILTDDLDEMTLKSIQAVLAVPCGEVTYEVLLADTAEEALLAVPVETGVWGAGRNETNYVGQSGYAIYIRLTSTERFAMETIRAEIEKRGLMRQRGRNR